MTRNDARKPELDPLPYVAVVDLRRDNALKTGVRVTITSTSYGRSYVTQVDVYLNYDPHLTLSYSLDGQNEVNQVVPMTRTPCHFGGHRWWMRCTSCYKRVGKLYLLGGRYACRDCHDLTYKSRMRNRRAALNPLFLALDREQQAEKLAEHLRTFTYRGQHTKRFAKIVQLKLEANALAGSFSELTLRKELGLKDK